MKAAVLSFLMVTIMAFPVAAEPFRAVFFDSYAPLSWKVDGRMQGILIDVLEETLTKRLDQQVEYRGFPWKRAQMRVKRGLEDAFVTVPTSARLAYTTCSDKPVLTVEVGLYTYAGHPKMDALSKVKTYDDLKGFTLVEYIGNGWAKEKFKHLDIEWARSLQQTYGMLGKKRADVIIRNSFNFDYYSKDLEDRDKFVRLPAVLSSVKFHLCIRKDSPHVALLQKFDQAIAELNATGGMDAIFAQYKQ